MGAQYSSTNDQEPGVDEPDVAKTNGKLLVVLDHEPLGVQVMDVAASPPALGGFVRLPTLSEAEGLFLVGKDAVVVGQRRSPAVAPSAKPAQALPAALPSTAEVDVVGLAAPLAPTLDARYDFAGQLVGARLVGDRVLLVLSSSRRPTPLASKPAHLSPLPSAYSPTVSLVALDPESGAIGKEVTAPVPATFLGGSVVYATTAELFVAAEELPSFGCCQPAPGVACPFSATAAGGTAPGHQTSPAPMVAPCPLSALPVGLSPQTAVLGFDTSDPMRPIYLGQGGVPGTLSSSYDMSMAGDYLRVVTTQGPYLAATSDRLGPGPAVVVEGTGARLTVLEPAGGRLEDVASLSSIGQGGDLAAAWCEASYCYISTTRSSATVLTAVSVGSSGHPVVVGMTTLPGLTTLLQPLGSGLLGGVGEPSGQGGLQLVVTNIENPSAPALASRQVLGEHSASPALFDHHALLWWPTGRLLVLPVGGYRLAGLPGGGEVQAWSVGSSGTLTLAGVVSQPKAKPGEDCAPSSSAAEQALVAGGDLLTVSDQGAAVASLASFAPLAWLAFPGAPCLGRSLVASAGST
jgi:hypothetical protein